MKHLCGGRAERLMFDAEMLDADTACLYGLAHQHLPRSDLMAAAMSEAEALASLDPRAYALATASVRRATLSSLEDETGRLLDRQVRDRWKDDPTRSSLERLLRPKC